MKMLCFDPSGNWGKEGFGHSGWALFENGELIEFGDIAAEDFETQEAYWAAHENLIIDKGVKFVICENYRLYAGARGKAQINSTLDTPQLIGFIKMVCWKEPINFEMQAPSDKTRVADPQLIKMGILDKKGNKHYCMGKPTNLHMRDAIRHGIYHLRYGRGKNEGEKDRI
jgi:hypothetical protein